MNTERAPVGWRFWLGWVLASTVGLAVGFPGAFAMLEAVGFTAGGAVWGAVVGASIGSRNGLFCGGKSPGRAGGCWPAPWA